MSMPDASEDAFGFESLSAKAKEKIRQIKPSAPPPQHPVDLARVDAIADNAGFVSREVPEQAETLVYYRPTRPAHPEPRIPLNMRVPVSLGGAFQRFCEENRYSYPEALAEIMHRAGLPLK